MNATGNIVMYTFPTALELIDSGSQFECVAVNEAGVQSSRSFELIVQGEPVEGAWEGHGGREEGRLVRRKRHLHENVVQCEHAGWEGGKGGGKKSRGSERGGGEEGGEGEGER